MSENGNDDLPIAIAEPIDNGDPESEEYVLLLKNVVDFIKQKVASTQKTAFMLDLHKELLKDDVDDLVSDSVHLSMTTNSIVKGSGKHGNNQDFQDMFVKNFKQIIAKYHLEEEVSVSQLSKDRTCRVAFSKVLQKVVEDFKTKIYDISTSIDLVAASTLLGEVEALYVLVVEGDDE